MQRRELWIGLYVALVWNLAVAALLNNPIQPSKHTWFAVMGGANELLGVLMIASPELLPLAVAALAFLSRRVRAAAWRAAANVRRMLQITTTHFGRASASITATARIKADVTRAVPRTLEDVIGWLTRQDQDLQEHRNRLDEMPHEWKADIARQAEETEDLMRRLISGLENRNLSLRLLGVGFVVIGLILSTTANLV
ncbi:MAG TPA: hypothetical protein VGH79_06335 [Gaiellaceae bacterium]|jgi:hypothetical protein